MNRFGSDGAKPCQFHSSGRQYTIKPVSINDASHMKTSGFREIKKKMNFRLQEIRQ